MVAYISYVAYVYKIPAHWGLSRRPLRWTGVCGRQVEPEPFFEEVSGDDPLAARWKPASL